MKIWLFISMNIKYCWRFQFKKFLSQQTVVAIIL